MAAKDNGNGHPIIVAIDAEIAQSEAKLAAIRKSRELLVSLFGVNGDRVPPLVVEASSARRQAKPRRASVRGPVDPELVEQVFGIVKSAGSINMPTIQKKAGGLPGTVKRAVKALVAAKRLAQLGGGRHTTYELRS